MFGFTKKKLVKLLLTEYRRYDPNITCEWNKDTDSVQFSDNSIASLTNIYPEFKSLSKKDRQLTAAALARDKFENNIDDFKEIERDLYPRIRTKAEMAIRNLYCVSTGQGREDKAGIDYWPLSADLITELVVDLPQSIVTTNRKQHEQWNVPQNELLAIAKKNLWSVSDDGFDEINEGTWQSSWRDNYDATRILLTEKLEQLKVQGQHVAFIPSRDVLLVTGSEDIIGLSKCIEITEGILSDEQRYISGKPYVLRDGKWEDLELPKDNPLFPNVSRLHAIMQKADSDELKTLAEQILDKNDQDIFVATHVVMQNDSGDISSLCTLSQGVHSYLPKSDSVALVSDTDTDPTSLGVTPWGTLVEVLGDKLSAIDFLPGYYEIDYWPTDEEIARLDLAEI